MTDKTRVAIHPRAVVTAATEPDWRAIARAAVGTTLNPGAIAEQFDVDESIVEENLAEEGVETCRGCGWWFEEFPGEDGDLPDEPTCEDCLKDGRE